jgi:hypothetical protein
MKRTHHITPLFILTVMVLLALIACSDSGEDQPGKVSETPGSETAATPHDSLVIELQGVDSLTAFELLIREHEVDYLTTAAGVFVRGIDSINGSDDYFWLFSVNDEMPPIAADRYMTRDGDRVLWHFRRINK